MAKRRLGAGLTGNYHVKATRSARTAAHRLFPKIGDYMQLRAHALKLRYWPQKNPTTDSGCVLDLDWTWIKSLPRERVGELRIVEAIAQQENLRLIFFVADKRRSDPRPIIWILHVMQKKRQEFTRQEITIFSDRKQFVFINYYGGAL